MSTATAERVAESQTLGQFASSFQAGQVKQPARISLNPDDIKNGLAKIALTVVEYCASCWRRQAIRRTEAGSLRRRGGTAGNAFLQLSEQMERLKTEFGLQDEDLNLDLGPLGNRSDQPQRKRK